MKFTKIFDMTDTESISSQAEHDTNHKLEYDDSDMVMGEDGERNMFQHDLDVLLPESKEIMSDWTCAEIKVNEINSDETEENERQEMSPTVSSSSIESMDSFYKPEADQKEHDATITRDVEE